MVAHIEHPTLTFLWRAVVQVVSLESDPNAGDSSQEVGYVVRKQDSYQDPEDS